MYYPFGYEHYLERREKVALGESIPAQIKAEEQALIAGMRAVPKAERHRLREISTEDAYMDWRLRLAGEKLEPYEERVETLAEKLEAVRQAWQESEEFWEVEDRWQELEAAWTGGVRALEKEVNVAQAEYEAACNEWHERCMEWYESVGKELFGLENG